ncbi:CMP-sialic acid transporter 4-like protein [Blastocystis sp. subtype 4]|uniref:CMP-sialic acid transporter 4-like protein n=1 Tax=Blastocystis sp. subtype 4 TaxID=944170 RepID=UPI00071158BD|nr:CMP-sialic acid transporter 4-like protein [Blastocystis sp. subtype 4]KNB42701.1 CMP-sialic acid transporter 4-like protein [Blastocystis sp. subtype 4]|eukprot:XP_014526144.1 CMP-sialic acid transporter 4-like protein [Blastocystis sp. subtype 4]
MSVSYKRSILLLSLLTHALRGTLSSLSQNELGSYAYSTEMCALTTEIVKMCYSFCILKLKSPSVRQSLTLRDILSMGIPAVLSAIGERVFYYLQTSLADELLIQAFESFEIVVIGIASVILLGRKLTGIHWASLILLCSAVLSIQISSNPVQSVGELPLLPCFMGIVFAGLQGTAGVCTERILKQNMMMDINQQNLWIFLYGLVLHSKVVGEQL